MLIEGTYLDAILDEKYFPLQNDTRTEIVKYLEDNCWRDWSKHLVAVGDDLTTLTVEAYLKRYGTSKKVSDGD